MATTDAVELILIDTPTPHLPLSKVSSFFLHHHNDIITQSLLEDALFPKFDLVILPPSDIDIKPLRQEGRNIVLCAIDAQSLDKEHIEEIAANSFDGVLVTKLDGLEAALRCIREAKGPDFLVFADTASDSVVSMRSELNGVVLHGLTIDRDGHYRFPPRETPLVREVQERSDFILLAHECIPRNGVEPSLIVRFGTYCRDEGLVGQICIREEDNCTVFEPVLGHGITPLSVLDTPEASEFARLIEELPVAVADEAFITGIDRGEAIADDVDEGEEISALVTLLGPPESISDDISGDGDWMDECLAAISDRVRLAMAPGVGTGEEMHQYILRALCACRKDIDMECEAILHALARRHELMGIVGTFMPPPEHEDDEEEEDEDALEQAIREERELERATSIPMTESSPMDVSGAGSKPNLLGQKEFGFQHDESDFAAVVSLQRSLRVAGLLCNLSELQPCEVSEGDPRENKTGMEPHPLLSAALERIRGVTTSTLNPRDIRFHIKTLPNLMTTTHPSHAHYKKVQLWESDGIGMKSVGGGHEHRYYAVSEVSEEGLLHIYIRRGHPNIAEAVVHQYLQSLGFNNTQCVLAEALVRDTAEQFFTSFHHRSLTESATEELTTYMGLRNARLTRISGRMVDQINSSSLVELIGFIQRQRKVVDIIQNRRNLTNQECSHAVQLANEVSLLATYKLLEHSKSTAVNAALVEELSTRTHMSDCDDVIQLLCHEACYRPAAFNRLRLILRAAIKTMEMVGSSAMAYQPLLAGLRHVQEAGLVNLEIELRDAVPYIVREVDMCTVMTEMAGHSDEDMRRRFGLSKHDVGKVLYHRVREVMAADDTADVAWGKLGSPESPSEDVETISDELSSRTYVMRFLDGLFFMLPFTVNLVLALITGVGIYTSTRLDIADQYDAGIGMILGFVVSGTINWAVSKLGSWYFFQWSFAVLSVVFSRLLWAGFLSLVVVGSIATAIAGNTAVIFAYTVFIGLEQLLIGVLFNSRSGSIWTSPGGRSILFGLGSAMALVMVLFFGFNVQNALAVHLGAQALLIVVLLIAFISISHGFLVAFDGIRSTSDADVMQWYHEVCDGPPPPPTLPVQTEQDDALVEWWMKQRPRETASRPDVLSKAKKEAMRLTRQARTAFASAVADDRHRVFHRSVWPEVRRRAKQWPREQSLLEWYGLLSGKTQPDPHSAEYEGYMGEAVKAMAVKTKTDVVHRGGLQWKAARGYMLHGLLYFLLLFLDRILRFMLTPTSGDFSFFPFFLPTSEYEVSVGWAQFFLLLAVGTLEAVPLRKSRLVEIMDLKRLKNEASLGMLLKVQKTAFRRIWASELWLCTRFSIVTAGLALGLMFITLGSVKAEEALIFGSAALGFLFFLLGGFNLLFTGNVGGHVTRAIAIAVLTGLLAGIGSVLGCRYAGVDWASLGLPRLKNEDLAVVGLLVGGIVYGVLSMPWFARESGIDIEWEFASKAPLMTTAMQTSGQHWIQSAVGGKSADPLARSRFEFAMATLLDDISGLPNLVGVSGDTGTGFLIHEMLKSAIELWKHADRSSLPRRAFPKANEQLEETLRRFLSGQTTLFTTEQRHLSLMSSETGRVVYSAISRRQKAQGAIEIFVAMDKDRPVLDQASQLAEALVHETFEHVFGYTHTYAATAEILLHLTELSGDETPLPRRIAVELEHSTDTDLVALIKQTDDTVLASSMINMPGELDRVWPTMGQATRALIVGLVRRVLCKDHPLTPLRLRANLNMGRQEYESAVSELCSGAPSLDEDGDMWDRRLALAEMAARMAVLVKVEARRQIKNRIVLMSATQRVDEYQEAKKSGEYDPGISDLHDVGTAHLAESMTWGVRLGMHIDCVMRLLFLAITGDLSFPAELAHSAKLPVGSGGLGWIGTVIGRTLFVLVFLASRVMAYTALWATTRLFAPKFRLILQQIQMGLNRTRYTNDDGTRVVKHDPESPRTAFVREDNVVAVYRGVLAKEPTDAGNRVSLCDYSSTLPRRLVRCHHTDGPTVVRTSFYSYASNVALVPCERRDYMGECEEEPDECVEKTTYDAAGRVVGSTFSHGDMKIDGVYTHGTRGHPADSRAVSHAFTLSGGSAPYDLPCRHLTVSFLPGSATVYRVQYRRTDTSDVIDTQFKYLHPRHPTLETTVLTESGRRGHETPRVVLEDSLGLISSRPPAGSFYDEDLIVERIPGATRRSTGQAQNIFTASYSTRKARTVLWRAWDSGDIEGPFAQLLDEEILRRDPVLAAYFRRRDLGLVEDARRIIKDNEGAITPAIDFGGSKSHLVLRVPDLYVCGSGGGAHSRSLPRESEEREDEVWRLQFDSKDRQLHVLGIDSGTWPADGGGVASCRRDVINRLTRLRWWMHAEIGSPMKLVQGSYQIETNVQSLTFTPMWGTELGGPIQVVLSSIPVTELAVRAWRTDASVVSRFFVPILTQLTNAAGLREVDTAEKREHATSLMVNIYQYFQYFDWDSTWQSALVQAAWRRAWMHIESQRSERLNRDLPTLEDVDFALSTLVHFFMPFTAPLPSSVHVVQATHHGMQAVVGAVSKRINGTGFIVWDHGILWRERVVALAAVEAFPLFVRNVLLDFTRLSVSVVFHNADVVVPVSTISNPEWELRLGGRNSNHDEVNMRRRISPVLNGMETDKFHVARHMEAQHPTVVMLSHVYDLKDIKTAIRSVKTIVEKYGLRSYKLLIYGALDKDLEYTDSCRAIISDNAMGDHVELMGLGNASRVLPTGWLFLNSSKSEGLPLALGEAGLAGLPVVCTDVGGSREVISDGSTVFGSISPARNPAALAEAQLRVLAMSDDLDVRGPELEERIMSKSMERQVLGMRFRAFVLRSFSMARYLREHEQLIWIMAQRWHDRSRSHDLLGGAAAAAAVENEAHPVRPRPAPISLPAVRMLREIATPASSTAIWSLVEKRREEEEEEEEEGDSFGGRRGAMSLAPVDFTGIDI